MLEEMFCYLACLVMSMRMKVRPCLQERRKILERARINFSFGLSAKISIGVVTSGEEKKKKICWPLAYECPAAAMFVFSP